MKVTSHLKRLMDYEAYRDQQLRNPAIKKYYDEEGKKLEIAYKILQLRKRQGMSQSALARKLGTTQSNIARLEAGQENVTAETLYKIARALKRDLKIEFVK